MAKRAPKDELPFRPLLDTAIISQTRSTEAPVNAPKGEERVTQTTRTDAFFSKRVAPQIVPPPPVLTPNSLPSFPNVAEKIDQEKRMLLTRKESEALDRVVRMLATRLNAQIKLSHVLRGLTFLLLNSEGDLDRRAGEVGVLTRPPNGDVNGIKEFDRQIAKVISKALRDAAPRLEG
jgi:hypothetical protein